MNMADSQRVALALEQMGYVPGVDAESADVIVLNTCVVRQQAEEKAIGRLSTLKPIKLKQPDYLLLEFMTTRVITPAFKFNLTHRLF